MLTPFLDPRRFRLATTTFLAACFLGGCTEHSRTMRALERADTFFAEKRHEHAELEYFNVLRLAPNHPHALRQLGAIYFEQGRFARALPFLQRGRETTPDDLENRLRLAKLYLASDATAEAANEAVAILSRAPNNADAPLILADAATSAETVSAARQVLASLPPGIEASPPVILARGVLHLRCGELSEARACFEHVLKLNPSSADAHTGLAVYYERMRDFPRAEEAYSRSATLNPADSPARLKYARFKLHSGDPAAARRILGGITEQFPNYVPALLRQAELAVAAGEIAAADEFVNRVLSSDAENPEAMLLASRVALARGEPDVALQIANKFLQYYSNSADGLIAAARVHSAKKDFSTAKNLLKQALESSPGLPAAVVLRAQIDLQQGETAEAVRTLTELLARKPDLIEAHITLAEAHRFSGQFSQAVAVYQFLEDQFPSEGKFPHLRGLVLLQQNELDAARAAFTKALARNPGLLASLERLVNLDLQERKFDTALSRVQAALQRQESADVHTLAAKVHLAIGEHQLAEDALRAAVALDRDHTIACSMLAGRYAATGRVDEALHSLQTVSAKHPRDTAALMMRAVLHEQRGDHREAKACYERVLEIDPAVTPALNNLAYLLSEHFNELERAHTLARAAREAAPADPRVADTLGWILHRRGESKWALSLLLESAASLRDSADVQFHLAMIAYSTGEEDTARKAFQEALTLQIDARRASECRQRLSILSIDPIQPAPETKRLLEKHLVDFRNDAVALDRLGSLFVRERNFERALELTLLAAQRKPESARLAHKTSQLYSALGDTDKAFEWARRAHVITPEDVPITTNLGSLVLRKRDYAWAYSLLLDARTRAPENAEGWYGFAEAALHLGAVQESISAYRRGLQLAPENPHASEAKEKLMLLGLVDAHPVNEAAVRLAKKRIDQDAGDVAGLMLLASSHDEVGDSNETRAILERLLIAAPSFSPAKRRLAILLAADGTHDERALKLGIEAQEAFSGDLELDLAIGFAAYRLGDHRRAAVLLDDAAPRSAKDPNVWFCLGMSLAHLNRTRAAREPLEKALDLGLNGLQAEQARRLLAETGL